MRIVLDFHVHEGNHVSPVANLLPVLLKMLFRERSVLFPFYPFIHVAYSINRAAYNIQHETHSIQHAAYGIKYLKRMQHTAYSMIHTVYSAQHLPFEQDAKYSSITVQMQFKAVLIIQFDDVSSNTVTALLASFHFCVFTYD